MEVKEEEKADEKTEETVETVETEVDSEKILEAAPEEKKEG